jgi:hypothetical protein
MNTDKHGFNFAGTQVMAMFGVPPSGGVLFVVRWNRLKAGLQTGAQSSIVNRQSSI